MKRVLVDWIDSQGYGGWRNVEDAIRQAQKPDEMPCQSVGYLVDETDTYLLIGQSLTSDNVQVSNTLQIPKLAITKTRELK